MKNDWQVLENYYNFEVGLEVPLVIQAFLWRWSILMTMANAECLTTEYKSDASALSNASAVKKKKANVDLDYDLKAGVMEVHEELDLM